MTFARYADPQCASRFSFLRRASGAEEFFLQVIVCGLSTLAITDHKGLAGIIRTYEAAKPGHA